VNIIFSRLAKRRMGLYNISESIAIGILENEKIASGSKQEIIKHVKNFELPLKIVFESKGENITIITPTP
jgi:hypothetical protein